MVSRFLASRLCSKVPVKAKAHVGSRSGRGGQSIPGGGVGGAPPPGNGFAKGKVPHFAPLCNTEPASRPTTTHDRPDENGKPTNLQVLLCGTIFVQINRRLACDAAGRASERRLAVRAPDLAPLGDEVGGIGVSAS